jgi:hypothetical protein
MPDIDFYWHQLGNDRPAVGPIGPITIQGGADPVKTESLVKGDALNPVTTLMQGDPAKPLTTVILGDPNKPVTTLMLGDPNKPITLSVKDLPQIQLSAEVGMKPTRIHNPLHFTFCISLFGLEIVTFAVCGEAMTIVEPYTRHKTEVCA